MVEIIAIIVFLVVGCYEGITRDNRYVVYFGAMIWMRGLIGLIFGLALEKLGV